MVHTHNQKEVVVVTVTMTPAQPAAAENDTVLAAHAVVDAIMSEAECCPCTAWRALNWITSIVATIIETGNEYHPETDELESSLYRVIDTVMPHDVTVPTPGSAHDLLSQLLASSPDRIGVIVHTMTGENDERQYCAFLIDVHTGGLGTNG